MTTPNIVYDPVTSKIVFDPATGRIVYANPPFVWDGESIIISWDGDPAGGHTSPVRRWINNNGVWYDLNAKPPDGYSEYGTGIWIESNSEYDFLTRIKTTWWIFFIVGTTYLEFRIELYLIEGADLFNPPFGQTFHQLWGPLNIVNNVTIQPGPI
jgi:hypothetical protein